MRENIFVMSTYDLPCFDHRKSFYGKARVIHMRDASTILESYGTRVCKLTPEKKFVRLWDGYSQTTMRHVNSFLLYFGVEGGGKAWWDKQDVIPA